MLPQFPIFSFSPRAAEQILKQCHYGDLFEIAQLSKRTFSLVQSVPKVALNVSATISSTSTIRIRFNNRTTLEFIFYGQRDPKRAELEELKRSNQQKIVVKIMPTKLEFVKRSLGSYHCDSNSTEHVILFIQHLCSLFNVSQLSALILCPSELHHLAAMQSVDAIRKSENLMIEEGTVSHEAMRRILGGFENANAAMEIWCNTEPNFTYDGPISLRHLEIYTGVWFNGPMLLNIANCDSFQCSGNCEITEEHLNMFLTKWLNHTSGGRIIEDLSILPMIHGGYTNDNTIRQREWDMERIVQGLDSFEQEQYRTRETRRFCRANGKDVREVAVRNGCCLIQPPSNSDF